MSSPTADAIPGMQSPGPPQLDSAASRAAPGRPSAGASPVPASSLSNSFASLSGSSPVPPRPPLMHSPAGSSPRFYTNHSARRMQQRDRDHQGTPPAIVIERLTTEVTAALPSPEAAPQLQPSLQRALSDGQTSAEDIARLHDEIRDKDAQIASLVATETDVSSIRDRYSQEFYLQTQRNAELAGELARKSSDLVDARKELAAVDRKYTQELADLRLELQRLQERKEQPVQQPSTAGLERRLAEVDAALRDAERRAKAAEALAGTSSDAAEALRVRVSDAEGAEQSAKDSRERAVTQLQLSAASAAAALDRERSALDRLKEERRDWAAKEAEMAQEIGKLRFAAEQAAITVARLQEDRDRLSEDLAAVCQPRPVTVTTRSFDLHITEEQSRLAQEQLSALRAEVEEKDRLIRGMQEGSGKPGELWRVSAEREEEMTASAQQLRQANDAIERAANPAPPVGKDRRGVAVLSAEIRRSAELGSVLSTFRRDICRDAAQRSFESDDLANQCRRLRRAADAIGRVTGEEVPEEEEDLAWAVERVERAVPRVEKLRRDLDDEAEASSAAQQLAVSRLEELTQLRRELVAIQARPEEGRPRSPSRLADTAERMRALSKSREEACRMRERSEQLQAELLAAAQTETALRRSAQQLEEDCKAAQLRVDAASRRADSSDEQRAAAEEALAGDRRRAREREQRLLLLGSSGASDGSLRAGLRAAEAARLAESEALQAEADAARSRLQEAKQLLLRAEAQVESQRRAAAQQDTALTDSLGRATGEAAAARARLQRANDAIEAAVAEVTSPGSRPRTVSFSGEMDLALEVTRSEALASLVRGMQLDARRGEDSAEEVDLQKRRLRLANDAMDRFLAAEGDRADADAGSGLSHEVTRAEQMVERAKRLHRESKDKQWSPSAAGPQECWIPTPSSSPTPGDAEDDERDGLMSELRTVLDETATDRRALQTVRLRLRRANDGLETSLFDRSPVHSHEPALQEELERLEALTWRAAERRGAAAGIGTEDSVLLDHACAALEDVLRSRGAAAEEAASPLVVGEAGRLIGRLESIRLRLDSTLYALDEQLRDAREKATHSQQVQRLADRAVDSTADRLRRAEQDVQVGADEIASRLRAANDSMNAAAAGAGWAESPSPRSRRATGGLALLRDEVRRSEAVCRRVVSAFDSASAFRQSDRDLVDRLQRACRCLRSVRGSSKADRGTSPGKQSLLAELVSAVLALAEGLWEDRRRSILGELHASLVKGYGSLRGAFSRMNVDSRRGSTQLSAEELTNGLAMVGLREWAVPALLALDTNDSGTVDLAELLEVGNGSAWEAERRVDAADGVGYTFDEFVQCYGGDAASRWAASPADTAPPDMSPLTPPPTDRSPKRMQRLSFSASRDGDVHQRRHRRHEHLYAYMGMDVSDGVQISTGRHARVGTIPQLRVNHVVEGGPAERCGIRRGDAILEVCGCVVYQLSDLREAVRRVRAGATVPVLVRREGTSVPFVVRVRTGQAGDAGPASSRSVSGAGDRLPAASAYRVSRLAPSRRSSSASRRRENATPDLSAALLRGGTPDSRCP
eukprot:TRINITY_DN25127_c0_g1_i2.p1 TRINITY_DN25127_c0_g1~~TRINITY_DN25127_c0_g1_i2.p1  ORF type:complete len:1578 (+),score=678.02 TRINITY_DN25127_c0_g1_i2:50-4735(+)